MNALAPAEAMLGTPPAATPNDDPDELAAYTRWHVDDSGTRVAESSLRISGMHCASCAGTIEEALRRLPGVVAARVNAAAECALVRWHPQQTRAAALLHAIEAAGYEAVPDTAVHARALRKAESRRALWRLFVAAFCAMQVMMLATPAYVSAPGELLADQKRLLDWGSWLLTLPVLWFSAAPFFAGAWAAVRRRRIGMDVPVAIGIAVAFIASSGAAFDPAGPFGHEVYFDSLTMFISFLLAGRFLEMRARHRAEAALDTADDILPASVMRLDADDAVEIVSAKRLQRGDRVRVPVGEAFAADGVLTDGSTQADESLLTGESRPVLKRSGDEVVAGSLNLLAPVVMRVERTGAATRYETIVALMRAARQQRPALLASADRWATPFLWAVLLLAAVAAAAWSVIDPSRAVWVAVSVLIVTCPCALSLAAPTALLAAAGAMGRRGVLLRRLDAIERLAAMQTLFVDKTGTLTEGRLRCTGMRRLADSDGQTDDALQAAAASLAAWSRHPLSLALRDAHAAAPMVWRDVRECAGLGIEATDLAEHRWRLGSARWVDDRAADTIDDADAATSNASTVWLGRDGQALAVFTFEEQLRDDAAEAVRALQADGVQVQLLSGDDPLRARHLAATLGLAAAHGGLAPDAKLAIVRQAQQRGKIVAMLGDGINDAPVLAQADVSLAMGEGATIARAEADGVLASNRLRDLAAGRATAKRALRIVRQNLAWAAAYNAACVPLALLGWLPPWLAGAGMATSSLVVVLNSLRLSR
jgi:Cu2+-exporting ATPase